MAMIIAIPKERRADEARVAATPETVKKLKGLGLDVVVERGAGAGAHYSDADYEAAGATIAAEGGALRNADIVLKVRGPEAAEIAQMKRGAILAALLAPATESDIDRRSSREAGVDAFAMEFLPRISRAQAMDVLSSQANLAGYKAVIDAAAAVRPRHADDDDGGRHHRAGARAGDGRRRRRAAGDRHGASGWAPSCRRPTCVPRPRNRWNRSAAPSSR